MGNEIAPCKRLRASPPSGLVAGKLVVWLAPERRLRRTATRRQTMTSWQWSWSLLRARAIDQVRRFVKGYNKNEESLSRIQFSEGLLSVTAPRTYPRNTLPWPH